MDEPLGKKDIPCVLGINVRNTPPVPQNFRRFLKSFQMDLSFELWETTAAEEPESSFEKRADRGK